MKKLILSVVFLVGAASVSFAQFTFSSTSATYTGNGDPSAGDGKFYSYQPGYDPGYYVDNACTVDRSTDDTSPDFLGGFDPVIRDATTVAPSRPGTIFYGGAIRNMYNTVSTVCTANTPSFGFGFDNGRVVDLSLAANQKLQFSYTNDAGTDLPVVIQLYDKPNYTGKLTTLSFTFIADGANHNVTLDLSSYVASGADMSNIAQVSFTYPFATRSPNFGLSFVNIYLGSSVVTSNQAATSINSSSLYPNPVSDNATLELNLVSPSEVKVVVYDLMGKDVMTVANGTFYEMKKEFSVASLNKGAYNVVYYVNGQAAKAELLMVK